MRIPDLRRAAARLGSSLWSPSSGLIRRLQFTFAFQVSLAIILSFTIGNIILIQQTSARLIRSSEQRNEMTLLYLSQFMNDWLVRIESQLQTIASNPGIRSLDPQTLDIVLSPIFRITPQRRWSVWSASGQLLKSSMPVPNRRLVEARVLRRPSFQRALDGQTTYDTSFILAQARLEGCLEISSPIRAPGPPADRRPADGGEAMPPVIGVIDFCLPFSRVGDDSGMRGVDAILLQVEAVLGRNPDTFRGRNPYLELHRGVTSGHSFFLVSPAGNLMFPTVANTRFDHVSLMSPRRLHRTPWGAVVDAARRLVSRPAGAGADQAQTLRVLIDGIPYLVNAKRITDGWLAASVVDEATVYAPLRGNLAWLLILQSVTLLVMVLVAYMICRQLSLPLRTVVARIQDLSVLNLNVQMPEKLIHNWILEVTQVSRATQRLTLAMDSFSRYLPKEVVRNLLASNQLARLGGQTRELAIMFTDIANFTSFTERLGSDLVIRLLNEYLAAVTNEILPTQGTIDKYIGDAVMVFWGAPLPIEHPCLNACRAALAIRAVSEALRPHWAERDAGLDFHTRIGIHYGPVIIGNVGCEERFNYTIVGDCVNTANRLETLNKDYGTRIIVSDAVVEELSGLPGGVPFEFRPLGEIKVRGKQSSTSIYELVGPLAPAAATSLSAAGRLSV
ncbi:MAG: adenylate/guanylate cyclase domain-containing protein [Synechococcus sp.]|nr:adenylate/guanylate cyclase domain-containing protein [Synechococcus sp.]